MLSRYMERVGKPRGDFPRHITSLFAVLHVVMLLHCVGCGIVDPDTLAVAITAHMTAFVAAYGADRVRPKHHYAQHLPATLKRIGTLISCLTHDRRRRVVKRYNLNF